jgi:hypothetical protein
MNNKPNQTGKQLDQMLEAIRLLKTMQPSQLAPGNSQGCPSPSDGAAALKDLAQELTPLWTGIANYCVRFIEVQTEAGLTREEAFWILQNDKLFKLMNNK